MKRLTFLLTAFFTLTFCQAQLPPSDVDCYSDSLVNQITLKHLQQTDSLQQIIAELKQMNEQQQTWLSDIALLNYDMQNQVFVEYNDTLGYDISMRKKDNNYWFELTNNADTLNRRIHLWLFDTTEGGRLELWYSLESTATVLHRFQSDSTHIKMDIANTKPLYLFKE